MLFNSCIDGLIFWICEWSCENNNIQDHFNQLFDCILMTRNINKLFMSQIIICVGKNPFHLWKDLWLWKLNRHLLFMSKDNTLLTAVNIRQWGYLSKNTKLVNCWKEGNVLLHRYAGILMLSSSKWDYLYTLRYCNQCKCRTLTVYNEYHTIVGILLPFSFITAIKVQWRKNWNTHVV